MNVVVLRGTLSRPSTRRTLPSGDQLTLLEVTTRDGDAVATVPVVWPAAGARELPAGLEVVVRGVVRRRYFRAAGATASRTEVVADAVAPVTDRRRARRVVDGAAERIASLRSDHAK